jgi:hypothetical protein
MLSWKVVWYIDMMSLSGTFIMTCDINAYAW